MNAIRQIRVLPLEPTFAGLIVKPNLPLAYLDGIERAAVALVEAVRAARGFAPVASVPLTSKPVPGLSVVEVCNEFLHSKAIAGRSENYLRVSLAQLSAFCVDRQHRPLASVSASEIEAWLFARQWSPVTRRNHLQTIRTLFAFAVARSHLVGNPALAVDMPTMDDKPPEIHAPDQVRAVLEAARDDLNVCRYLAIRYFAGLRGSEAASLDENNIHPGRGFIEVTAAKSKTRRRRLVTIQPALAAWLALGGVLPLGDVNTKLWKLTRRIAFPWPRNVTRHSFVSYHLAHFQSASKTALEAGHTEQILFNHYREVVTREAAADFWNIRPK